MTDIPYSGMCEFKTRYDFEKFSRELKHAIQSLDLLDVTITPFNDGSVIVIHEYAKTKEDFTLSHMVTKKIVEAFGGSYSIQQN